MMMMALMGNNTDDDVMRNAVGAHGMGDSSDDGTGSHCVLAGIASQHDYVENVTSNIKLTTLDGP